jgi:hypothetical protein
LACDLSGSGSQGIVSHALLEPRGGGVHVCSLDRHSMHVASQVHLPYEHGIMTLADRVEQLLDDPRRLLATEWARTAFDVQDNPVLACERLDR